MEIALVALRPRPGTWFFLVIAIVAMSRDVRGQDFVIPRISQPIDVDGHVREQAWLDLPPLPMTMFEPEFRAPIARTSTIRLAHDGRYLYAAGVFVDDAVPTANSLIRDHYAEDRSSASFDRMEASVATAGTPNERYACSSMSEP
jgi:hypothetical protein